MDDLKVGTKILVKEGDSHFQMVFLGWEDPETKQLAIIVPFELAHVDNISIA